MLGLDLIDAQSSYFHYILTKENRQSIKDDPLLPSLSLRLHCALGWVGQQNSANSICLQRKESLIKSMQCKNKEWMTKVVNLYCGEVWSLKFCIEGL